MKKPVIYVPARLRGHLDDWPLVDQITHEIEAFQRSFAKAITDAFDPIDITKVLIIEHKSFKNTNNMIIEIRCRDRVIGTVYNSRTEFNHQEVLFTSHLDDVWPYIQKDLKDLSKRFK
jgi:hypothetical protein